jgi:hypothetical protein
MTRIAALLMMGAALASCGPGTNDNPPQLFLAIGSDELHATLVAAQPPHY